MARPRTIILLSWFRSVVWAAIVAISIHNYWRVWPLGGFWLDPGVFVMASLIMQHNSRSILTAWLVSGFWMLLGVVLNIYLWSYLVAIGASAWQSRLTIFSLGLFIVSLLISICGAILAVRLKASNDLRGSRQQGG
jgi:hypothetical protein